MRIVALHVLYVERFAASPCSEQLVVTTHNVSLRIPADLGPRAVIGIKGTPRTYSRTAHSIAGHPEARSVTRGDPPPEGEAVWRPCGPEEDGVVRASHWRGHLEEAIEEETEEGIKGSRFLSLE